MKRRLRAGPLARAHLSIGLLLALAALPAAAQMGPLANQNLFFDQAAAARRGNYLETTAGLVYSDNVTRDPNGRGDTLALLGLLGNLARNGPRLDLRLASDITLVKYVPADYQTRPFGYLDALGDLWIVPGFFSWTGRETYTQTVLDPFVPVTPDNLESLNYVSTGPRFTVRPTLRTSLTVEGSYSYITGSSKSPLYVNIDNHRYAGDATVSHAFTGSVSGYITATAEKVDFIDQNVNTNFRDEQGLAGLKVAGARTVLDAAAGYTEFRVGSQKPTGTIYRFSLSRQISPSQRASLHALQQITDAANLFRTSLDQPVPATVAYSLTTGQPFTHREFGADWRIQASRTSLELAFLDFRDHYRLTPNSNREVQDGTAFLSRQMSPVLTWDVGGELEHQTFSVGGSSTTVNAITDLRWQAAQQLGLRILYARSSLSPHGYHDNQVGITASYAFLVGNEANAQPGQEPGRLPSPTPGMRPGSSPPRP